MIHHAYIALGSNLASRWGTPLETLRRAAEQLEAWGEVERISSFYVTEPVGIADQPAFVNAALSLLTPLSAAELMANLLDLERAFGRDRSETVPKGPRILDLDLLFFDDLVLNSRALKLPHPELAGRRFVLQPLAQIAPRLMHPVLGLSIGELLDALPDEGPNGVGSVNRMR